ncbi:hypothetical protein Ocin01_12047 [Orchesella cincta]|uniref:Uncharacterized protein n=1 Tax=Orchesella cincta TaxID=48709 RepID=A0A1D2MNS2_ORCCI|nr:hypothetical protein Ocin01_12047 [Orchesella cincta]
MYEVQAQKRSNSGGVRRVVSDAASGNEDYLGMAFSDDFDNQGTAETIRFTHNDKEFEIVEQLNKAVQTDPETNGGVEKIFQRTQGLANMSKGTATEPQVLRQQPELQQTNNNNKQQQTNHDLAEIIELKRQKGVVGSSRSRTALEDKATGNDYDPNVSTERCYYTRPVQDLRSVGEQFGSASRDNGVQACIYDVIFAENKCTKKKPTPGHHNQDQRIISECMLKTGISTRFQPALSCNTICPRILPNEPSRGHLNICREDFRTLSRCANLTWSDVVERTEGRCTSSSNDENYNQQCCRRPDNNYEPNLSDNCPVQRNYACRVPSERDKKSWFSWW